MTIICSHGKKLDGPSGIVREVGSLILAGSGNLAEQVSKIPQLDLVFLGENLCPWGRTPCNDDPFVVARRGAILPKLGDDLVRLELLVDEIVDRSALPRCLDADIELLSRKRLVGERKDVEKRIARIVSAVEAGGDAPSLVAKLRDLEKRLKAIAGELSDLRPVPRLAPGVIENRLKEWRRLLRSSTTQGRTVLQRILPGPITFTLHTNPLTGEVDGYDFEAPTRFDKLFTGIAVERPAGRDEAPLGHEHIGPEDTFEGDYGRLLEQAYRKGVKVLASPTGFEPA